MFETIIQAYYEKKKFINFNNNYISDPPILGISLDETVDFTTLYDIHTNNQIGTIQFNNINKKTLGNPNTYVIVENISVQFNNNTSLFALNYYKSDNNDFYQVGTKYIIPITSATGYFLNKTGFIVIDVEEDNRLVTIGLN